MKNYLLVLCVKIMLVHAFMVDLKNYSMLVRLLFITFSSFIRLTLFAVTVLGLLLELFEYYWLFLQKKLLSIDLTSTMKVCVFFSLNSYWFPCFLYLMMLSCFLFDEDENRVAYFSIANTFKILFDCLRHPFNRSRLIANYTV